MPRASYSSIERRKAEAAGRVVLQVLRALRDSASAGAENRARGKAAAKKKPGRRAAAKAKPAAPRRRAG